VLVSDDSRCSGYLGRVSCDGIPQHSGRDRGRSTTAGFTTRFSGLGVFSPDRRPTQRIGIVPDIVVTPTIAGIRAGRDEVLEEAIRQIR